MKENENNIFEMKLPELNTFVYEWYEETHKPVEIKFHRGNATITHKQLCDGYGETEAAFDIGTSMRIVWQVTGASINFEIGYWDRRSYTKNGFPKCFRDVAVFLCEEILGCGWSKSDIQIYFCCEGIPIYDWLCKHWGDVQDYGSLWDFHNGKFRLKEGSYSIEDWF